MRTTLDIDDDVLDAAKQLARAENKSAGRVISELARKTLNEPVEPLDVTELEILDGIPVLPSGARLVTSEMVKRLIEQADLEDGGLV